MFKVKFIVVNPSDNAEKILNNALEDVEVLVDIKHQLDNLGYVRSFLIIYEE